MLVSGNCQEDSQEVFQQASDWTYSIYQLDSKLTAFVKLLSAGVQSLDQNDGPFNIVSKGLY